MEPAWATGESVMTSQDGCRDEDSVATPCCQSWARPAEHLVCQAQCQTMGTVVTKKTRAFSQGAYNRVLSWQGKGSENTEMKFCGSCDRCKEWGVGWSGPFWGPKKGLPEEATLELLTYLWWEGQIVVAICKVSGTRSMSRMPWEHWGSNDSAGLTVCVGTGTHVQCVCLGRWGGIKTRLHRGGWLLSSFQEG